MGENSFNDATNKGLISKMYKQLIQLNRKKKKHQPNGKISRRTEDISPKTTEGWPKGTSKNTQHH